MSRPLLAIAILLVTSIAHGDTDPRKATSLDHYRKGRAAYAAGNFTVAISEFERAYQAHPAPEYLHDIAQAYRRLEKCDALSYFERYLAEKPDARNRSDVERSMASLRDRCSPAPVAPSILPSYEIPRPPAPTPSSPMSVTARAHERSPYSLAGSTGILFLDTGPVITPAVPQLDAGVRRTVLASTVTIDAGAALSIATVPYDDGTPGTMWLVSPQLVAECRYELYPRISLVGGVRLGALVIAGLDKANPYTQDSMPSSAITTASARLDLGVAWHATDRLHVHLSPVGFQWSPHRAPLASDIPSLRALAMSAGVIVGL